jgi:hypothetical protein
MLSSCARAASSSRASRDHQRPLSRGRWWRPSAFGENEATSWNVGDTLLLVFAAFIAVVCGGSGLALLVISIASFFD